MMRWTLLALAVGTFAACDSGSGAPTDAPSSADVVTNADVVTTADMLSADDVLVMADVPDEADVPAAPSLTLIDCPEGATPLDAPAREFIVAPYLIEPTATSMTIQWEALDDGPAAICWREGDAGDPADISAFDHCVCAPPPHRIEIVSDEIDEEDDGWLYRVTLTGLSPRTRYTYTLPGAEVPIQDPNALVSFSADYEPFGVASFLTAPTPPSDVSDTVTPFTLAVYGDNQPFTFNHESVVAAVLTEGADLVLHTGDIVHDGVISEYRYLYFLMASPLLRAIPHLHVAGNHEGDGDVIPFDAFFPMPGRVPPEGSGLPPAPGPRTGFFDYDNARFFILDTQRPTGAGSDQLAWLDAMLEATVRDHPEITWLFCAWHRPTYTSLDGRYDGPKEALHEVMTRWQVDAVWNGHAHTYERFLQDGVTYIVAGGGGAGLGPLDENGLEPGDNRMAGESAYHIVRGEIGAQEAVFRAIRAEDLSDIDSFTLTAHDRSALR